MPHKFLRTVLLACMFSMFAPGQSFAQAKQDYRIVDGFGPFYNPKRPPPNSWAMPYAHLDSDKAPWVDTDAFEHSCQQFEKFCLRVGKLGYTHAIVGNLIHCAEFKIRGKSIYAPDSPFLLRAKQYKKYFKRINAIAKRNKMKLVMETDFPAWTPPLKDWLGESSLSVTNPRMLEAYTTAIAEVFTELDCDALSVRIGEGGGAYNEASGYKSTVTVRSIRQTQETINFLCSIINKFNEENGTAKKLLFRTWTIGIGEIGALHTNPGVYKKVFSSFYAEKHLITVMKHVAMDFFDFIPVNPTIGVGKLPQIVEFQARREYEGFHLYPNYRGPSFKRDIQQILKHENVRGVSVWPTNGGFLQTASIGYCSGGTPAWIDVNVFAYAKLLDNPNASPFQIVRAWLQQEHKLSDSDADTAAEILVRSESRITRGMYLRPYAANRPAAFGLDYFPSMLWLYWTRPVAALGVQSFIFRFAQADITTTIKDGEDCVNELEEELDRVSSLTPSPFKEWLLRSLEYQKSYYTVLRDYRRVFMNQHSWVETGDSKQLAESRSAAIQLSKSMADHRDRYAQDRQLPAMDLRELDREVRDIKAYERLRPVMGLLLFIAFGATLLSISLNVPGLDHPCRDWRSTKSFLALAAVFTPALTFTLFFYGYQGPTTFLIGLCFSFAFVASTWLVLSQLVTLEGGDSAFLWTLKSLWGPLFSCTLVLFFMLWRSPIYFYHSLVAAIFADPGAILWLLMFSFPVLVSVPTFFVKFRRESNLSSKQVNFSFGMITLFHAGLVICVLWLGTAKHNLLWFNDVSRFAPSILDKAGTGVEELTGAGEH